MENVKKVNQGLRLHRPLRNKALIGHRLSAFNGEERWLTTYLGRGILYFKLTIGIEIVLSFKKKNRSYV